MEADILEFNGSYRWLSNFWPAEVVLDGVRYESVEHAYQAAKTTPEHRGVFQGCTAAQAKKLGRKVPMRADWNEVRLDVMRELLAQKFAPGTPCAQALERTGNALIVEGNWWGDTFWGVCRGRGENHLGRLLMEQRARLRGETLQHAPTSAKSCEQESLFPDKDAPPWRARPKNCQAA